MKPQQQNKPLGVPSSMEVTNAQISNVLIIMNNLFPYLVHSRSENGMDKGVTFSAETTFVKACIVLDDILADKKRWSGADVDAISVALEHLYQTQAELNSASAAAVTNAHRPSFLLKPTIVERKPGEWVAQYGSGRNALKGIGPTPHQAMLAFDMAYYNLIKVTSEQQPPNEQ